MSDEWKPPPKIEGLFERALRGNAFSGINRPTAGPRTSKPLPRGEATFQLYSLATPNGWKVGILLEEMGIDYDAHIVNIGIGQQFTSGFVSVNPNSKIPAAIDYAGPGDKPIALMESAAIMTYLCDKHERFDFFPSNPRLRSEILQWLFWQIGNQGPMTGNFGHFFVYAPSDKIEARDYGVARYGMEVKRLCDVLERHLAGYGDFSGTRCEKTCTHRDWLVGNQYTIADMAIFPWAYMLRKRGYDRSGQPRAQDFLSFNEYKHLNRWIDRIASRDAVQRGIRVCSRSPKPWLNKKKRGSSGMNSKSEMKSKL